MGTPPGFATLRAGNVYGGGDWAEDRLVPDSVRAFASGRPVIVRNPGHHRPWQHIIDVIRGYLAVAQSLARRPGELSRPWNLGPGRGPDAGVGRVADLLVAAWGGEARWEHRAETDAPTESRSLSLDSEAIAGAMGWRPRIDLETGIRLTVHWYRAYFSGSPPSSLEQLTLEQIHSWEAGRGGA